MSQENVELVRQAAQAFNARVVDRDTEQVLGAMHPEIEFRSATEQRVYRGIAEMRRYRQDLEAILQGFHTEGDRFLDVGDDRVVHLYRVVGRGAQSGVPVSRDVAIVWQVRGGKLFRGQVYLDQAQALEAAGLSE
jgi:ketosteroid isomerase-like protein